MAFNLRNAQLVGMELTTNGEIPRIERPWIDPRPALAGRVDERGAETGSDRLDELVLNGEEIGEVPVVAVSPHMVAGLGVDQLGLTLIRVPDRRTLPSTT